MFLVLVLSVKPVLWLVLSSLVDFTSRVSMQTHLFLCKTYKTNKCLQSSCIPRVKIPLPNQNTFGTAHEVHILHPNKVQPCVFGTQSNKGLLHYLRYSPGKSSPGCVNAEAKKTKYGSRPGQSSVCWQHQSKNQLTARHTSAKCSRYGRSHIFCLFKSLWFTWNSWIRVCALIKMQHNDENVFLLQNTFGFIL